MNQYNFNRLMNIKKKSDKVENDGIEFLLQIVCNITDV